MLSVQSLPDVMSALAAPLALTEELVHVSLRHERREQSLRGLLLCSPPNDLVVVAWLLVALDSLVPRVALFS